MSSMCWTETEGILLAIDGGRCSGGITLGTDSYFPPEVEVRLVRLVSNRDCVSLRTGEWARCINYGCIQKYRIRIQSV